MMNLISIHTSAREVTGTSWRPGRWLYQFQSTLPQGKWLHPPRFMMYWSDFNPHFRKGSDSMFEKIMRFFNLFQSTLPQGKWPISPSSRSVSMTISIHTSAREVTVCFFQLTVPFGISIHTSAREVTNVHQSFLLIVIYFNPHFRKGSDCPHRFAIPSRVWFQSTLPQGKWQWIPNW